LIACFGVVSLWAMGTAEREACAAAVTVTLEYRAGAGCPDVAEFRAVVIARLGRDPFSEDAPDHVLAQITPRMHALDGQLEWRDVSGRWAGEQIFPLVTTDCVRLTRTMGFALAVQIQLLADTRATSEPDGATAANDASAAAIASKESRPLPIVVPPLLPPRYRPGPELVLGAGSSLGVGMASTPVLLGRLLAGFACPTSRSSSPPS
jgi:hypothetical protein